MTKEMKAPPKKVGSARSNVYTTHFIRARLIFLAPVPISPGLGLPSQKSRARVKFWFGRDNIWYCKVVYTTKFTRAELFGYAYHFYPSPYKNFPYCKWGFRFRVMITQTPQISDLSVSWKLRPPKNSNPSVSQNLTPRKPFNVAVSCSLLI